MYSAKRIVFAALFFLLGIVFFASGQVIAWYPLASNPNDTTGQRGAMYLVNAPFQGGGIYCNGNYSNCVVETPVMPSAIFKAFTVRIKFKLEEIINRNPLLIGGGSYRWIGILLNRDSTLTLMYNNIYEVKAATHYTLRTWHEAMVNYDSVKASANLYLDGVHIASAVYAIEHSMNNPDRQFLAYNPATATCYKGYMKDLRIYLSVLDPTSVHGQTRDNPVTPSLQQNYPNPFNPRTNIEFTLPEAAFVTLKIFDLLGREITTLVAEQRAAGIHRCRWNGEGLPSGVYLYRLAAGDFMQTKRLILLR